ncbi:T9SS type A sorting domain-containing protein [Chitinophaga polysaccharea]|uniref:T9SS type A sorting domain-containing protein n=1 Tax=Chitinophaga TaxID=79328 RepID=UPI0014550132|nr:MULTISPECIES: T9SS type A sorting domain-containing protein [Chitinophaga]NLR56976.1 T9SS type A sorting domain-containing protein [Chitinophaga polysaccharea]NLU93179.1 T9SS type A sorting domain-containing protein [Chitinophaga sp. Ak27]
MLLKKLYIIPALLLLAEYGSAQQGVYIPTGATVWLSGNTNVGIFSDMTNNGKLGSNPNSIFYFLSKLWTNGNGATLPDESADGNSGTGGTFVFSNTTQQKIFGGYSFITKAGPSFPNLQLNNISGLLLDDLSDLKIRNNLHFASGHIYLNGWNLQVGDKSPGTITGYSDKQYVVTGNGIAGGLLYRAAINNAAGKVVFPVGTDENSYAPAAVLITGATDMIGARVYDSVFTVAAGGAAYKDSFVNKTWNIRREDNSGGEVDVILQHMDASELPAYASSRDSSFITRFVTGVWDQLTVIPNKPLAGTLTTSPMLAPATMHLRHFDALGTNEFFAKTALIGSVKPVTFLNFEAFRIAPVMVQLDWTTLREVRNMAFEVERRYEREETFRKIGVVLTKAVNGNSSVPLGYTWQDPNDYDDWTYYRIKAIGLNGKVVYSEVRAVPPFVQINVFPNPNNGTFKVQLRGIRGAMLLQMRDVWSQVMRQYEVKSDMDIDIRDLPSGVYFLVIYHKDTMKLAYTCKVIVTR